MYAIRSYYENQSKPYFEEYLKYYKVPEWETDIADDLKPFLSTEELNFVLDKKNRATHLLALQSKDLKQLKKQGLIEGFPYVNLENQLKDFYTHQGKCERIRITSYNVCYTKLLRLRQRVLPHRKLRFRNSIYAL